MFQRSPLGFDPGTPRRALRDLGDAVQAPARTVAPLAALGAFWWTAAAVMILAILAGSVVERRKSRWWSRVTAALAPALGRPVARGLSQVIRRAAVPAAVTLVWNVAGLLLSDSLVGDRAVAWALVAEVLWIWTGYRLVDELAARVMESGAAAANRSTELIGAIHRLIALAAVWWAGSRVLDVLATAEVAALWMASGHLLLVVLTFSVLARKRQVLELLPDLETPVYRGFVRLVALLYFPLVYLSLVIGLLWVVGYRALAEVFLGRSWAIIGIGLLGFLGYHYLRAVIRRRLKGDPAAQRLQNASQQLFGSLVAAIATVAIIRTLGLWPPWVQLLDQPWVRLGSVRVQGQAIWAAALTLGFVVVFSSFLQEYLAYRIYPRVGIQRGEAYALNRLLHYAFLGGAILLAMNVLGLSPAHLALLAGGLSIGIGLGLQDVARNIAGGLILLTTRQVRQGDVITLGTEMGTVREVNLRSTVVTTFDNVDLLVPNSKLLEETVTNWTHSSTTVRSRMPFSVAYGSRPASVIEAALNVARADPEVLTQPAPEVWLRRLGDSALEFELLVWVDLHVSARSRVVSRLYCALLEALDAAGIEVPFPQSDVHLRSGVPWDQLLQAMRAQRDGADAEG